jgi:signal transduction histidine kinase
LQWKVVLTIVGVGLLPLAAGLLWAGLYGRSALIDAAGEKFTELAKLLGSHVDFIIDREIHEAQSLALAEELRDAVTRANASPDGGTLLSTAASRYLTAYQTLKQEEYEEIIATDRRGRAVAATRPLRQQRFADEPWWQAAYHNGRGAVSLAHRPDSDGNHPMRMALAFPITDQQSASVIGVIYFLMNDLELDQILREVKIGATGHAMLVQADGRVLLCALHPPDAHPPIAFLPPGENSAGWTEGDNGHGAGSTVIAASPVAQSAGLAGGDTGGPSWWVMVTQDREELFAPIHRALWIIGGLSVGLMGALVLLGLAAGRRLVRPILALQQGAEELGRGNLAYRLRITTGDELEALAQRINRMAEHLQQSADARLKAERLMALHRLSTVLTHDLRSPMVGILKALALLEETYGQMPAAQARQLLADLTRGGELLLGTLNDLLDVYRHSLSALPLRYTDVELDEAVNEVIRLLTIDAEARGINLRTAIASPGLILTADRRRLQRVVFNLLDNAIKHSPPGGRITVSVGPAADGLVTLLVDDEGPGVPDTEQGHIFDFLSHATNAQADRAECSGIGVGLYFCRMTIEAHGGRIAVENRPGGGARFTITLPTRRADQPEPAPALAAQQTS